MESATVTGNVYHGPWGISSVVDYLVSLFLHVFLKLDHNTDTIIPRATSVEPMSLGPEVTAAASLAGLGPKKVKQGGRTGGC